MLREGLAFNWRPLPYSRREVEGIATLFPKGQVQTFLGADATEDRIKNLDPNVRVLHLAAHAFVDDHLPLSSFVALTIPEDLPEDRDNGLLQAWEILEQVRIDADLVVLSGCMTGLVSLSGLLDQVANLEARDLRIRSVFAAAISPAFVEPF